jgi:hypothetical protein
MLVAPTGLFSFLIARIRRLDWGSWSLRRNPAQFPLLTAAYWRTRTNAGPITLRHVCKACRSIASCRIRNAEPPSFHEVYVD